MTFFFFFLVDKWIEDPNTALNEPSSVCLQERIIDRS